MIQNCGMRRAALKTIHKCISTVICVLLLVAFGFGGDGGVSPKDLKGIPKHHKYFWAVAGGTAAGAGIGILLPGGNKTAVKGLMIGSSGSSLWYLWRHPNGGGDYRSWAYIATNTTLGGGVGWSACNCGTGFGFGALVGGGGTALIQAMGTRSRTIAGITGAEVTSSSAANTPPPGKP